MIFNMGKLEQEVRKRERYGKIEKAILGIILAAGVLSVAVVAPNILKILPKARGRSGSSFKQGIEKATTRLVRKGLLTFERTDQRTRIRITQKGKQVLLRAGDKKIKLRKPKRWDKKWRVVIFDVPEHRRVVRNKIRVALENIGFLKLQHSVWVYPYDCEDFIVLLKADFKIGKDVLYIIAEHIEYDQPLKKHFNLR